MTVAHAALVAFVKVVVNADELPVLSPLPRSTEPLIGLPLPATAFTVPTIKLFDIAEAFVALCCCACPANSKLPVLVVASVPHTGLVELPVLVTANPSSVLVQVAPEYSYVFILRQHEVVAVTPMLVPAAVQTQLHISSRMPVAPLPLEMALTSAQVPMLFPVTALIALTVGLPLVELPLSPITTTHRLPIVVLLEKTSDTVALFPLMPPLLFWT